MSTQMNSKENDDQQNEIDNYMDDVYIENPSDMCECHHRREQHTEEDVCNLCECINFIEE